MDEGVAYGFGEGEDEAAGGVVVYGGGEEVDADREPGGEFAVGVDALVAEVGFGWGLGELGEGALGGGFVAALAERDDEDEEEEDAGYVASAIPERAGAEDEDAGGDAEHGPG